MPEFKYLDATDLPSDPNGSLGQLRTSLRQAYNTNRTSLDKMRLLSDTLAMVVGAIEAGFEITPDHEKSVDTLNQEKIDAELPEVETPVVNPKRTITRKPTTKD